MPYKVEVMVSGEKDWTSNALVFASKDEADGYGRALAWAWLPVKEYRVVETKEKPNYKFIGPGNWDIEQIDEEEDKNVVYSGDDEFRIGERVKDDEGNKGTVDGRLAEYTDNIYVLFDGEAEAETINVSRLEKIHDKKRKRSRPSQKKKKANRTTDRKIRGVRR